MFQVNNKNTRTTSLTSLDTIDVVSIVDFEQVNIRWDYHVKSTVIYWQNYANKKSFLPFFFTFLYVVRLKLLRWLASLK